MFYENLFTWYENTRFLWLLYLLVYYLISCTRNLLFYHGLVDLCHNDNIKNALT